MFILRGSYKALPRPIFVTVKARTSAIKSRKTDLPTRSSATMAHTTVLELPPKGVYPGFGLPLRNNDWTEYKYYPIGAHGNIWGSDSEIIPVRELAAMDIMEKLTDKENWHVKVFDEDVVAKWRKEALAIPDDHFWNLAVTAKRQHWGTDDLQPQLHDESDECELEGIMDDSTIDTVCPEQDLLTYLLIKQSV
jgi:hypothetical protein